jgi:DNA replication and repair protein RecF
MIIKTISVVNYKNIRQAELFFSENTNCFFGNNGVGKTNLLDAIYYLSFCKSHKFTTENHLITYGEELCVIQGQYELDNREEDIFCAVRTGQKKQFKRNKKEYERLSDHIGLLPVILISPSDLDLIDGGSDERRRFVDMIISQQDKVYLNALIQYNKALLQRNILLKERSVDTSLFDVLEMQLEMYGNIIYKSRKSFVEKLIPYFRKNHNYICDSKENVDVCYISQLSEIELAKTLNDVRQRDIIIGNTSAGIHKDDIEMRLNEQLIRRIGSQGQKKSYLISLKLAQYLLMVDEGSTKPVLLLDDFFDKLDSVRVERIVELVSSNNFGQIFITDTNREYLDRILEAKGNGYSLFKVETEGILSVKQ